MKFREVKRGQITCREMDDLPAGGSPQVVVILCHGFGAPGTDLVSLGEAMMEMAPRLRDVAQFLFPEALLSLAAMGMPGGRAWWPLDLNRLVAALERGEKRILCQEIPPGLETARLALINVINEILTETHLPASRLVLGGFSQGSMLATEVALRLPQTPGGLAVWSGTLLCEAEWKPLAAKRGAMPVVLSHGRQDPLLPLEGAEWLRDLLTDAGMPVEFLPFSGGHQISENSLQRTAELILRVAESVA